MHEKSKECGVRDQQWWARVSELENHRRNRSIWCIHKYHREKRLWTKLTGGGFQKSRIRRQDQNQATLKGIERYHIDLDLLVNHKVHRRAIGGYKSRLLEKVGPI